MNDQLSIIEVTDTEASTSEDGFSWDTYLESTASIAAPEYLFKHVEVSIRSAFERGMRLEIVDSLDTDMYWPVTVTMACGQLLKLRWDGDQNAAHEFWADAFSLVLHPIGWGAENNKRLCPPSALASQLDVNTLPSHCSNVRVPSFVFNNNHYGTTAADQFKEGMKLEIQHLLEPLLLWPAVIISNVGGRLKLQYVGDSQQFWLFYLHYRVHPIGWAKANGLKYSLPEGLCVDEETKLSVENIESDSSCNLTDVFEGQDVPCVHKMCEGYKVEIMFHNHLCAATVVNIISEVYFLVEIDDLTVSSEQRLKVCCHGNSSDIFAVDWSKENDVQLSPPNGWNKEIFIWSDYLAATESQAAPRSAFKENVKCDFECGMKLEAVNPGNADEIIVATVTRIVGDMLWLRGDCSGHTHVVSADSLDIFPVGWCTNNKYPLKAPLITPRDTLAQCLPAETVNEELSNGRASRWCPRLYFRHRCHTGPHLCKSRVSWLPRCVGPGPLALVLKEVLSMMVNVAYKPRTVLRELQLANSSYPQSLIVKAKCKGRSIRAIVNCCKSVDEVDSYLRHVCRSVQCCANLITPHPPADTCPLSCMDVKKTTNNAATSVATRSHASLLNSRVHRAPLGRYGHRVRTRATSNNETSVNNSVTASLQHKSSSANEINSIRTAATRSLNSNSKNSMMLKSNPLWWSVDDVVAFIQSTDCAGLSWIFRHHDIDGQAMMMLTLPIIEEILQLRHDAAVRLCIHIESVKLAFYQQYS